VGLTAVELDNEALLLLGFDFRAHEYVSRRLFATLLPAPLSVTVVPTRMFCVTPASASVTVVVRSAARSGEVSASPPLPPPQPVMAMAMAQNNIKKMRDGFMRKVAIN
jgi:hypothetical protein